MFQAFETVQKTAKDNLDLAVKGFGTTAKGVQAITTETADYTRSAFQQGTAALETLSGVKSVEKALELQADFVKTAYEGFVAYATKVGGLVTDLTKETMKPVEVAVAKAGK